MNGYVLIVGVPNVTPTYGCGLHVGGYANEPQQNWHNNE